jgi:hypothetical protein
MLKSEVLAIKYEWDFAIKQHNVDPNAKNVDVFSTFTSNLVQIHK